MIKKRIKFNVIKEDIGYSYFANISGNFISTEAETFEDLKNLSSG
jgi:hypothetical protein